MGREDRDWWKSVPISMVIPGNMSRSRAQPLPACSEESVGKQLSLVVLHNQNLARSVGFYRVAALQNGLH